MSTVDTSTWSPDADLNVEIEGIPLNADASIQQTWQIIRILMAAFKGDTSAIQALMVPFSGATASADGASGFVPAPEAGDQDKVLKGDGTWGNAPIPTLGTASRAVVTDGNKAIDVSSVTATELGCLSGVTSAVQTQLDAKAGTAAATQSAAGLMSAADKAKLDGLPTVSEMGAGYIRYSNGLQMCFETVSIATGTGTGALDSSGNVYFGSKTVTFPKAFSAAPVVTLGGQDGGSGLYSVAYTTLSASQVLIEVYGRNSNVTCTPGYFAIGTWS